MSLTSVLNTPQVRQRFRVIQPRRQLNLDDQLKVPPRSTRYTVVGTAMDYLLRFEIQRRVPTARDTLWVAETAASLYQSLTDSLTNRATRNPDTGEIFPPVTRLVEHWYFARDMRRVIANARQAWDSFRKEVTPSPDVIAEMARHALRLARLDPFARAYWLDEKFTEVEDDDVQELVSMLRLVPFTTLLPKRRRILLNPTFGAASFRVGGADADLITADLLVDFKCTKEGRISAGFINQLLGYFLLVRRHRRRLPSFPAIKRVGIYFCRHGHLWTMDVAEWIDHPEFAALEYWFWSHAVS